MDEFGLDPESELGERVDRVSAAVGQDEGAAGA